MILQRHRALRLTADLLLHVKRHIQLVRESGLLQLILRCPAFGRLLFASRQWGIAKEADHTTYEFPLAFSTKAFITVGTHVGTNTKNAMFIPHIDIKSRSSFVATFEQSPTTAWMYYIAIGY